MTKHEKDDQQADIAASLSTDADGSLFPTTLDNARITQAQLADLLGLSRQAINKQVRRGAVRVDADNLMPARRALADWRKNVDQSRTHARFNARRTGPAAPDPAMVERLESLERRLAEDLGDITGADGPVPGSHAEARTQLLRVQLERARFMAERDKGDWVRVSEVMDFMNHFAALVEGGLKDLPLRIVYAMGLEGEDGRPVGDLVRSITDGWQWEMARGIAALNPNGPTPIPGDPLAKVGASNDAPTTGTDDDA